MAEKLTVTAKNIAWTDHESSRPAEATREQVADLQARLGYRFGNLWLLRLALVHSSAAPTTHNGILAWVGDAALYLVLSEEVGGKLGYVPIGQLRCAGDACLLARAGARVGWGRPQRCWAGRGPAWRAPPPRPPHAARQLVDAPPPLLPLAHPPAHPDRARSEVRKTLIGRAMCEQYATKLGLAQHLVLGKSYRSERPPCRRRRCCSCCMRQGAPAAAAVGAALLPSLPTPRLPLVRDGLARAAARMRAQVGGSRLHARGHARLVTTRLPPCPPLQPSTARPAATWWRRCLRRSW